MQSKFVKSVMASLLSLALCVPESIPSSAVPPTVAPILLKEKVGNVAEPVARRRPAGRGHAGRGGRSHAGRSHAGRSYRGSAGHRSHKGTANRSRSHKGTANRNVNRNTNRNVNRNANRNVNRNVNRNTRYSGWTRGQAWRWHGWSRPVRYSWAPGAAIAAGAAIGWVSAATAYAWAGASPAEGMCWYYTDASRTHGFWDVCE